MALSSNSDPAAIYAKLQTFCGAVQKQKPTEGPLLLYSAVHSFRDYERLINGEQ